MIVSTGLRSILFTVTVNPLHVSVAHVCCEQNVAHYEKAGGRVHFLADL
jgi:hypothetical protein